MSDQDYPVLDFDSLRPGQLCTVLKGRLYGRKSKGGGVAMMNPLANEEMYAFWKGWPLQVVYVERSLPYVLCDVLKGPETEEGLPPRIKIDKRDATLTGITREYVRQYLGLSYQTTL